MSSLVNSRQLCGVSALTVPVCSLVARPLLTRQHFHLLATWCHDSEAALFILRCSLLSLPFTHTHTRTHTHTDTHTMLQ